MRGEYFSSLVPDIIQLLLLPLLHVNKGRVMSFLQGAQCGPLT